jgi:hypothetical protein
MPSKASLQEKIEATRFELSQEKFVYCGSQQGQIRAKSQPRIIPRIGLAFRDANTVPSMV